MIKKIAMLCETYLQKSPSYTVNPIKIIIESFNCEHKNFSVTLWPSIYLVESLPLAPSDSAIFALQPKQIALQDFPYNRRSIPITLSARPFDCLSVRYDRKSAERLSRYSLKWPTPECYIARHHRWWGRGARGRERTTGLAPLRSPADPHSPTEGRSKSLCFSKLAHIFDNAHRAFLWLTSPS